MEKDLTLLNLVNEELGTKKYDIGRLSSLTLAYVGDAVFELIIRSHLLNCGETYPAVLNKKCQTYVNATNQAKLMRLLDSSDFITEQERAVYKRGRNSHSGNAAKNASIIDYRTATGFEALIGYLYLQNNNKRIIELVKEALRLAEEEKEEN